MPYLMARKQAMSLGALLRRVIGETPQSWEPEFSWDGQADVVLVPTAVVDSLLMFSLILEEKHSENAYFHPLRILLAGHRSVQ